jgi:hypothetical protein
MNKTFLIGSEKWSVSVRDDAGLKVVEVSIDGGKPVEITQFTRNGWLAGLAARITKGLDFIQLRAYVEANRERLDSAFCHESWQQTRSPAFTLGAAWPR